MSFSTIPELFYYGTTSYSNPKYLNYKTESNWKSISTTEFFEKVKYLTLGIHSLKLKRGESFIVAAPSSPSWLLADLAIQIAGHISVALDPLASEESIATIIKDSQAQSAFIEADTRAHSLITQNRQLKRCVSLSQSTHNCGCFETIGSLSEKGRELDSKESMLFLDLLNSVRPDNQATTVYGSIDQKSIRGVELTHKNLVSQVKGAGIFFPLDYTNDRALSILSPHYIFERIALFYYLSTSISIYFHNPAETLYTSMTEAKPTVITAHSDVLEQLHSELAKEAETVSGPYRWFARRAFHYAESEIDSPETITSKIYDFLWYRRLKKRVGGTLKQILSDTPSKNRKLSRFFSHIGIPLYEGYSQDESASLIAINRPGYMRFDTVGQIFPQVEVTINEDGEILAKGPNIMKGYHNHPADTKRVIDNRGFLHTGYKGRFDEKGYLVLT